MKPVDSFQRDAMARIVIIASLFTLIIATSGCSNLSAFLFYPNKHYYQHPEQIGLVAERVKIETSDGDVLANWLVQSVIKPKGTILFLHGNGENISTHINSVAWLPVHGYEVFLLDYRGYGRSTGESTLRTALSDIEDAHRWLSNRKEKRPLYVFGQSLGGALAITYTANYSQDLTHITALVSEAAPASWPRVAREAMRNHWLTWLLQVPASLITARYDAEDHLPNITSIPILIMHSKQDSVVAYHHGKDLYEAAGDNAQWLELKGKHIAGLNDSVAKDSLLMFLESNRH